MQALRRPLETNVAAAWIHKGPTGETVLGVAGGSPEYVNAMARYLIHRTRDLVDQFDLAATRLQG
jgi:hypothetical protein